MREEIIFYSFEAWTKNNLSEIINNDSLNLYATNLESLMKKIKLFNKVLCFECWYSITFYKWKITFVDNKEIDRTILDAEHFPKMIGAHKIKVWGGTYEI